MVDLTVADVAREVQASEWTVRQWLRRGDLRGYRLPGRRGQWRVQPHELDAFREAGGDRR